MLKTLLASLSFVVVAVSAMTPAFAQRSKTFERERTQKLNSFDREGTQKQESDFTVMDSDPTAPTGQPTPASAKPKVSDAEVAKMKRELARLERMLESSKQMFEDAEGNQSAQIKILSTMTMLKIEIRKVTEKLNAATGISGNPQNDSTAPTADQESAE